jgi:predicted heme/steroid binding protein
MTKILITVVVILGAAGLFFFSQQAEAPTLPVDQAQVDSQDGEGNPFGKGAAVVGSLEATSTPEGTDAPVPSNEESTAEGVTRAELAKHNRQADCWIAYKGTVYDITSWLPRHPGSAAAISPYCGTAEEFAAAFNRQHGTGRDGRLKREGVDKGAFVE